MRVIGENIVLREFRAEDISAMRAWVTDNDTARFLGGTYNRPNTWEDTENYLRNILNGNAGGYNFAVAEKETLRYIGQCNLLSVDFLSRSAELAIVLCPDAQGTGIGFEAVKLLLSYAFDTLNLNRVWLKVWDDNERAIRCYQKAGFRIEGTLREDGYREGRFRDRLIMGILRREAR
ncbi:MAG: GNAT family N-acetyltransferase [Christensenellales bacterium]|jgi:RimJ/RimL family protein N-acetyltransferase